MDNIMELYDAIPGSEGKLTRKMLYAAVKKAVEVGLLPKHSSQEDYLKHYDQIKDILLAALNAE